MSEQKFGDSSLAVIENFYGTPVSLELVSHIRKTPFEQLEVLAVRLDEYATTTVKQLGRRYRLLHYGEVPDAHAPKMVSGPVFVHDGSFLHAGQTKALAEAPELKHLLLYSKQLVLPDFTLDWAYDIARLLEGQFEDVISPYPIGEELSVDEQSRQAARFSAFVRQLVPLADLIRAGTLILTPSRRTLSPSYGEPAPLPLADMAGLGPGGDPRIYWRDPYLAWLVVNRSGIIEEWEFKALGIDPVTDVASAAERALSELEYYPSVRRKLDRVIELARGPEASLEQLEESVEFQLLSDRFALTPVSANAITRLHLTRAAKAVMEGAGADGVDSYDGVSQAVKYSVPALSDVSLRDLTKLRLQEDVYEDARNALDSLVSHVTEIRNFGSYEQYQRAVENLFEDLVRPTYERLKKAQLTDKAGTFIKGHGAGGAVQLGINGLATLLTGPAAFATHKVAAPAGKAVKDGITKKGKLRQEAFEIACNILLSVLAPGVD